MGCVFMSKLKKWIIRLGIILAVAALAIVSWELFQKFCLDDDSFNIADQIKESKFNQEMVEEYFNTQEFNVDRFMESINKTQKIIVAEETGIANISYSRGQNDFWAFLIESRVDISVEYKAIISIDPNDIKFIDAGDHVIASYSESDIKVESIEILNENIINNKKIFGMTFNDDVKATLKKMLVKDVREKILNDEVVIENSKESIEEFYNNMAKNFDARINFITEGGSYSLNDVNYDGISEYKVENTNYSYDPVEDFITVGHTCRLNDNPRVNVSCTDWNEHFTQTNYSVVEEKGYELAIGVDWNDQYVKNINNVMHYRDPQYGYLPIYALNIDQIKEYGKVYDSKLFGSVIEIKYPDGSTGRGIIMDACGQCAKESKIDLWVYHDDNSKHIEDINFKFTRIGWGNDYNQRIFDSRMNA